MNLTKNLQFSIKFIFLKIFIKLWSLLVIYYTLLILIEIIIFSSVDKKHFHINIYIYIYITRYISNQI